MDKNTYCVIMAGGIGSRFWPYSRTHKPKQFLDILGTGKTLLNQTIDRYNRICPLENILIVTNNEYGDLILKQNPMLKPEQILREPLRKNTAPCIAFANARIQQLNSDARVVVAPADHLIKNEEEFIKVIERGLRFIEGRDALLTLGITPTRPETGYGYIQTANTETFAEYPCLKKVKTFTEKPNLELAKIFLESGDFYWNSGMFLWSIKAIHRAFEKYLPDMQALFAEGKSVYNTPEEPAFIQRVYGACDKISIDYGLMEKADNVYVMCADIGWSDLGTWGSLYDHIPKDKSENAIGTAHVIPFDSHRNMIQVSNNKLTVIQGLDEYIIVDTEDVLLICKKEDEQNIRQIVDEVKVRGGEKYI